MSTRLARVLVLGLLASAIAIATAVPAMAACHVAAFIDDQVIASEGDGTVTLTVELQGRVGSCEGTVDVTTVDDTAVAGEDYEALTTTLTFVADDDREEQVTITLLDDDVAEGDELFMVELSNTTGSIASTGGAGAVTITDDDEGDAPADDAPADDAPAVDATADDAPASDAPADDPSTTELTTEDVDTGTGGNTLVVIVIALAVIGGAAFLGRRGRAG